MSGLNFTMKRAHRWSKLSVALLAAVAAPVALGAVYAASHLTASVGGASRRPFPAGPAISRPANFAANDSTKLNGRALGAAIVSRPATPSLLAIASTDATFRPSDGLSAPLDLLRVTSSFGMRLHPILGFTRMHQGVDFGASEGTPVLAAADGVIADAGPAGGYGNLVQIRHAGGWETGYAHLAAFAPGIVAGTRVKSGELIAFVGHTGLATGPHLHFEVSLNGVKLDPMATQVAEGGAHVVFRWADLLGQARVSDLAYRQKAAPVIDVQTPTPVSVSDAAAPATEALAIATQPVKAQPTELALLAAAPHAAFDSRAAVWGETPQGRQHLPTAGGW